jgi:hypothetical protein
MIHFINLTSRVINKLYIVEIIKKPSKYYIHMSNNRIDGSILFGCGGIDSKHNIIEICETKNKPDYDIITNLIKINFV